MREARGGIRVRRIDDVDQMMRDPRTRRGVGLRGSDVHAPVDLGGIDADDLAAQALRKLERKRALARRGRTHQQDRWDHNDVANDRA